MVQRNDFEWHESLEGAFGRVHRVIHRRTGDQYAIKSSKFAIATSEAATLQTELHVLSRLNHPNVLSHVCSFEQDGQLFIVSEFLPCNLLQHLESQPNSSLSEHECRMWMLQLMQALAYIHSKFIYHRDLKPENLLLDVVAQRLVLCDFGCSRFRPTACEQDELTGYVATRWYRAPELLLRSTHYSSAVDMWASGCVLAEMLEGVPLFGCDTEVHNLHQIASCLGSDALNAELRKMGMSATAAAADYAPAKSLHARFSNLASPTCIDFLSRLLVVNAHERMSAAQALNHPWLAPLQSTHELSVLHHLPHLSCSEKPERDHGECKEELTPPHAASKDAKLSPSHNCAYSHSQVIQRAAHAVMNEQRKDESSEPLSPAKRIHWQNEDENGDTESLLSHVTLRLQLNSLASPTSRSSFADRPNVTKARLHRGRASIVSEEKAERASRLKIAHRVPQLTPVTSPHHSRAQSITAAPQAMPKPGPLLEALTGHSLLANCMLPNLATNDDDDAADSALSTTLLLEHRPVSKQSVKRREHQELLSTQAGIKGLNGHSFLSSYKPIAAQPHPSSNANARQPKAGRRAVLPPPRLSQANVH